MASATLTLTLIVDTSAVQDLVSHFRAYEETIHSEQIDHMQELLDTDHALITFTDAAGIVHVEPSLPMIELMADVSGGV